MRWYSNQEHIVSVFAASEVDIDIAVKAARTALADISWKSLHAGQRGELIMKLASLIDDNKLILATIESWDTGMTSGTWLLRRWPWPETLKGNHSRRP